MAFLSSLTGVADVAPASGRNENGKKSCLPMKKDAQSPIVMMGSEKMNDGDKSPTSIWQAFQDRLYNNNEAQIQDSTKSFFFLNEEMKRVESKAATMNPANRRTSSSSLGIEDNALFLSKGALEELEERERSLPDRWLDYFCIIGIDPDADLVTTEQNTSSDPKLENKPVLLDRYPKENRTDMEFPEHLPTFCFPNGGCKPLRFKKPQSTEVKKVTKSSSKSTKANKGTIPNIKFHHNAPEPSLCSIVLTSGSGHRLYCTALTVYEMREDKKEVEEKTATQDENNNEPEPIPVDLNKNWWEEPTIDSMTKNIEEKRKLEKSSSDNAATTNTSTEDVEYYWMVPKSLVMISHYPFFQAQSVTLKELFYTVQSGLSPVPFERYVAHLVDDLPLPRGIGVGGSSTKNTIVEWRSWITAAKECATIRLERPAPNRLPLLNVSMEPLFRTLSLSNILVLWATLLQEGKVVLACSSSDTTALLTPIAESLLALLFPLEWQGIYIPVLPNHESVMDVLEAPIPYLIGLATDSKYDKPQNQPGGVLWCDLDNDILHLGFKEDHAMYFNQHNEEEVPLIPALPGDASMRLKAELEEIADPLFLPTFEGTKGRITVGDRTIELDNALRQPYAQRTKIFDKPMPTPRKYILTQSSKIPPRGKALLPEDFVLSPHTKEKPMAKRSKDGSGEEQTKLCGLALEDIQITTDPQSDDEEENASTKGNRRESSQFLTSLKRQSRSVQAHVDRAMAVLGQDYATPSRYASCQFSDDVLGQQDEIAANFFLVDENEQHTVTDRVRESFLRFFLATFANYKSYIETDTNCLDVSPFLRNLGLATRQREYVREVVTTQMFERFLHDDATSSVLQHHRRLFDEYIVLHKAGNFCLRETTTLKSLTKQAGTPLLNSSQWRTPEVIDPGKPCSVGLKQGHSFCSDRRIPDRLDPEECITKKSVSAWRVVSDWGCCGIFSTCS